MSGTIGAAGGSLELAGHRLTIPAGALSQSTTFTLAVPAGRTLMVSVTARSTEPIRLSQPAAVTISYDRCERQNLKRSSTSAVSLNIRTDAVMASLGGESDLTERTVTFSVDLSSDGDELFVARGIYAVAY